MNPSVVCVPTQDTAEHSDVCIRTSRRTQPVEHNFSARQNHMSLSAPSLSLANARWLYWLTGCCDFCYWCRRKIFQSMPWLIETSSVFSRQHYSSIQVLLLLHLYLHYYAKRIFFITEWLVFMFQMKIPPPDTEVRYYTNVLNKKARAAKRIKWPSSLGYWAKSQCKQRFKPCNVTCELHGVQIILIIPINL